MPVGTLRIIVTDQTGNRPGNYRGRLQALAAEIDLAGKPGTGPETPERPQGVKTPLA